MAATKPLGDIELVEAVRGGDDRAFGVLFDRYHDDLLRFVKRTQPKGTDQAEDILQDVFASALQAMRSTDREIIFKPWIYRIAHNACIDRHRRGGRYSSIPIDAEEMTGRDESRLGDASVQPDRAVERKMTVESLRKAFAGLDDAHHEILVMREFEGRSYDAIATRMSLSQSAVQSTLFRARQRLKAEYDEITTGERCKRVQIALDGGASDVGTGRTRRRFLVHIRDCEGCRRHAAILGLDQVLTESASQPRLRERVAALLPFEFLRQLGSVFNSSPDHVSTATQKLAIGGAAAVLLIGGGVAVKDATSGESPSTKSAGAAPASEREATAAAGAESGSSGSRQSDKTAKRNGNSDSSNKSKGGSSPSTSGGTQTQTGSSAPNGSSGSGSSGSGKGGGSLGPTVDGITGGGGATNGAGGTVDQTLDTVHDTVGGVSDGVGDSNLPGSSGLGSTVDKVNDGVQDIGHKVTGGLGDH